MRHSILEYPIKAGPTSELLYVTCMPISLPSAKRGHLEAMLVES